MKRFKFLLLAFISLFAEKMFSQEVHQPQMAEGFYKEGKVYVVIVILSIILVGIVVYLFSMDRKLNKLEKELSNKK